MRREMRRGDNAETREYMHRPGKTAGRGGEEMKTRSENAHKENTHRKMPTLRAK